MPGRSRSVFALGRRLTWCSVRACYVMAEIPPPDRSSPRYFGEGVDAIVARRAVVDQCKGVLMHIHDVDADVAFQMLRSKSRETNVSLCHLVKQILADTTIARRLWD